MKRRSLSSFYSYSAAIALSVVIADKAKADYTIDIGDAGFDTQGMMTNGDWSSVASPWVPSISNAYQQNSHDNVTPFAGTYALFLANNGALSQDLGVTVAAGDTLSFTFEGGNSNNNAAASGGGGVFTAAYTVGSTTYTQSFDTTTLTPPGFPATAWETLTFTQQIANSGDLSISFLTTSGHPWLDSLSDITVTTPEPTSLSLLASGMIPLLSRRRRQAR